MLNKKIITIGIVAIVALAVFYLGNMVMKTTPPGDTGGTYQYKVVSPLVYCSEGYLNGNKTGLDCLEKTLNDMAQEGWEYDGLSGDTTLYSGSLIFRKK